MRSCNMKEEKRIRMILMGATRYQVKKDGTSNNKWIRISFDDMDDTTKNYPKAKQKLGGHSTSSSQKNEDAPTDSKSTTIQTIPDSVLQWERQMRKIKAADRASKTNVNIQDHLHTIYQDENIVVTSKPSGILCVPGVNKNKSLLDLVYEVYGDGCCGEDDGATEHKEHSTTPTVIPPLQRDSMIVHRLDMDTSE